MQLLSLSVRRPLRRQTAAMYFLFVALFWAACAPASANGQSNGLATLTGVVLNASTNQPIARALVRVGSRAVLTEHDGRFEFSESGGTTANLQVMKPGFYDGPDANSGGKTITFSTTAAQPINVYLYPEALLTGTLTAPNGDPLPGIVVQALRQAGMEDNGGSGWMPAGVSISNADGEFRLPLPAGDYIVETQFLPSLPALQKAVLPLMVPDAGASSKPGSQQTLHLTSGSEQHLDLRPQVRSSREIHVRVEGGVGGYPQGFPQMEAHLADGLSFFPPTRPSGSPGDMIVTLPGGHYELTLTGGDRDGGSFGEAAVDVPDPGGEKETAAVILHLTRAVPLTIELSVDPAAAASASDNQSASPPNVQQLGLHFVQLGQAGSNHNLDGYLRSYRNEAPSMTLLPGRYRLMTQPLDRWFIESATIGGTDLMTQELDIEPGGIATPLRLILSNQTAALKGTVKLDGAPGVRCWIYLVAASSNLVPLIVDVSTADGNFSKPAIPPGSYRALASEAHLSSGLNDAKMLERLAPYTKSFSVAAGETANLDLEAIPTQELMR